MLNLEKLNNVELKAINGGHKYIIDYQVTSETSTHLRSEVVHKPTDALAIDFANNEVNWFNNEPYYQQRGETKSLVMIDRIHNKQLHQVYPS